MDKILHPNSFRGEPSPAKSILESLQNQVAHAEAVVASTLPRGGLFIVQPQRASDWLVKGYARQWQTEDDAAWSAIRNGKAVIGDASGTYIRDRLVAMGYGSTLVAPLAAPVFEGYPGVIELFRRVGEPAFTDAEARRLTEVAARLDEAFADARHSRNDAPKAGRAKASAAKGPNGKATNGKVLNGKAARAGSAVSDISSAVNGHMAARVIGDGQEVFAAMPSLMAVDSRGRNRFGGDAFAALDSSLRQSLLAEARAAIDEMGDRPTSRPPS